jgi:hypothetical protein
MKVTKEHRAEIALSSLNEKEQGQLNRVLKKLESLSLQDFFKLPKKKLTSVSNETLYVLKGNPKLRIIITLNEDANFDTTCTVEDIFDYQRLEQFPIFKQVA